jgi:hypothetical protein
VRRGSDVVVIGIGFHGFELGEHIWYSVDDPGWAFVVWYVCVAELQRGHVLVQGESLVIANQVIDCVCPGTETWIVVLASHRRTVESDVALWGVTSESYGHDSGDHGKDWDTVLVWIVVGLSDREILGEVGW